MWTRNGSDTLVGFIPGSDIDESTGATVGGLAKCPGALQTLAGWTGKPALGGYTYPSAGASEDWDFQKAKGFIGGPVSYRAFSIPNGYTIADVKAGTCDALWTTRAQNMVKEGQGTGIYSPGYEGTGSNFNGSAGQKVDVSTVDGVQLSTFWGYVLGPKNWAYAVSRQVHVMRQVAGWDCWIDLNYSVYQAQQMGMDDNPFRLVTESFQSIGDELYPYDDFKGTFSASNPADHQKVLDFNLMKANLQINMGKSLGVPIMWGEAAPMINPNGHTTGDDPVWVQWMKDLCMNLSNNIAAIWLYNGVTGDTSRCFLYNQTTNTYTKDTTKFPLSSQKIIDIFDPANFINRSATTGGTTYTQAQLDAAVLAQKNLDAQSSSTTQLAALQTQYDADHAQLVSTQTELAEAYAQIQKTKDDWATFWGNFAGPPPGP